LNPEGRDKLKDVVVDGRSCIYDLLTDDISKSKSVPPSGRMITEKRIKEGKTKRPGRETDHSPLFTAEV
jgi:hypothetical protein